MWHFSATRPLSATPRREFVVHSNSTQVLRMNSTKVVHTSVIHTNSTKELLTNMTKVLQIVLMYYTRIVQKYYSYTRIVQK